MFVEGSVGILAVEKPVSVSHSVNLIQKSFLDFSRMKFVSKVSTKFFIKSA